MSQHTFTTTDTARLRACIVEELATAADALSDAIAFARNGDRDAAACAHDTRRAIATITWAGDLLAQLGGHLASPDDYSALAPRGTRGSRGS
jgi:hypothetical protein